MSKAKSGRTEVTVQIGHRTHEYVAVETTAPPSYDGFGTTTIKSVPVEEGAIGGTRWVVHRLVLVEKPMLTWQVERYASGLHLAESETERMPTYFTWFPSLIEQELYDRMTQGGDQ